MSELAIIHPAEKRKAAEAIAQAAGAAGYRASLAQLDGLEGDGIVERARGAPAALLIWSRPLASAAVNEDWLPRIRNLSNLIEVSTDGIAPDTGEAGLVVLLSGWRGQPHHLGWRKLVERLEAMQLARSKPAPVMPERAPAPTGAPGQPQPVRGTRRTPAYLIPAFAAVALGVAALAWTGSRAPQSEVRPGRSGAQPVAAAPLRDLQAVPAAQPPAAQPASPAVGAPVMAEAAAPAAVIATPPPVSTARPARPKAARASAVLPIKRYSRRNSGTMRQFCVRSGRGTPQCRIFLASQR